MESPPYPGGERATTGRGLMLASSRYDGIVPAQTSSLMSLTTLKSRRWADEAAGRCSACRHRRSTSQGELPTPSQLVSQRLDLTVYRKLDSQATLSTEREV